MGYINDESFLFNINRKTDKGKTFNINNYIVEMDKDSEIDSQFNENINTIKKFNERTKRKMIIEDITTDNQWCEGAVYKKEDIVEKQQPIPYNSF